MKVADVMTRTVISVTPDTTVRECIKLLRENKISGVPVVAGRNIVGIITENDVSRSSRYPNTQGTGSRAPSRSSRFRCAKLSSASN